MSDNTFEKMITGKSLFQIYLTSEFPMSLYSFSQHSTAALSCAQLLATAVLAARRLICLFFISSDMIFKVKGCLFLLIDFL